MSNFLTGAAQKWLRNDVIPAVPRTPQCNKRQPGQTGTSKRQPKKIRSGRQSTSGRHMAPPFFSLGPPRTAAPHFAVQSTRSIVCLMPLFHCYRSVVVIYFRSIAQYPGNPPPEPRAYIRTLPVNPTPHSISGINSQIRRQAAVVTGPSYSYALRTTRTAAAAQKFRPAQFRYCGLDLP